MTVAVDDSLLSHAVPGLLEEVEGIKDVDFHLFFSVDGPQMLPDDLFSVVML